MHTYVCVENVCMRTHISIFVFACNTYVLHASRYVCTFRSANVYNIYMYMYGTCVHAHAHLDLTCHYLPMGHAAQAKEKDVCCSVLQCVAVCCSVLHCVVVCCSLHGAGGGEGCASQCVAVCCSV